MNTKTKAAIATASLQGVSARYLRGEITYEQMDAMQRATWDLVEADGFEVKRATQRLLRDSTAQVGQ